MDKDIDAYGAYRFIHEKILEGCPEEAILHMSASVIIFFALGPALTVQPPSRGESDHLCPQFLARVSHMAIWSSTMCVGGWGTPL